MTNSHSFLVHSINNSKIVNTCLSFSTHSFFFFFFSSPSSYFCFMFGCQNCQCVTITMANSARSWRCTDQSEVGVLSACIQTGKNPELPLWVTCIQNACFSIFLDNFRAYKSYGDDINIKSEYGASLFILCLIQAYWVHFAFKNSMKSLLHSFFICCLCLPF